MHKMQNEHNVMSQTDILMLGCAGQVTISIARTHSKDKAEIVKIVELVNLFHQQIEDGKQEIASNN